jgi:hypothetical protein
VERKETAVRHSGLTLLAKYNILATLRWNHVDSAIVAFVASDFVEERGRWRGLGCLDAAFGQKIIDEVFHSDLAFSIGAEIKGHSYVVDYPAVQWSNLAIFFSEKILEPFYLFLIMARYKKVVDM